MNYNNKLIKYIVKNLLLVEQGGGLIGNIPINKLDQVIKFENLPEQIKRCINLITIPNTNVIPVGSGTLRIQRFPSDVDIMNIVEKPLSTDDLITSFIDNLKIIINNIKNDNDENNVLFSDFKAGGMHWTIDEILSGVKNNISLRDACKIIEVIKLDIFVPYNRRYLEMSTFYVLKSTSGFVNVDKNYFNSFKASLLNDIHKFKTIKPFKAIKRLWSLSKINNDIKTMKILEVLINSNLSLLSQITADIETLKLMIEKKSKYNKSFVIDELANFKDRTSHILDIEYNEKKLYEIIDNLIVLFNNDSSESNNEKIIIELDNCHDYVSSIINRETINYLNSINFKFPAEIIKPNISHVEKPNISHVEKPNISHVEKPNISHIEKPNISHIEKPSISHLEKPNEDNNLLSHSIILSMMIIISAFII